MKAFLLALLVSVGAPALQAATIVNVSFTAAGSSRFYNYFYNVYAQLDRGNNLYAINDGPIGPPGGGSIEFFAGDLVGPEVIFPALGNWANAGSFTLNGTATGVGVETFSTTGASFDFGQYMRYDDSPLAQAFGNYSTLIDPGATGRSSSPMAW